VAAARLGARHPGHPPRHHPGRRHDTRTTKRQRSARALDHPLPQRPLPPPPQQRRGARPRTRRQGRLAQPRTTTPHPRPAAPPPAAGRTRRRRAAQRRTRALVGARRRPPHQAAPSRLVVLHRARRLPPRHRDYDQLPQTRGGYGRLHDFGIRFGYERVVLYIQPKIDQDRLQANTARTMLLLDHEPPARLGWTAGRPRAPPR
jgi:hypothetical protein